MAENAPEKRYRPYQRVIAGIGIGCLVIVVGFALLLIVASICAPSDTNDQLPVYTPTPADIDAAYSTAISGIDDALETLDQVNSIALKDISAAPDLVLESIREARNCDIPIDGLTNDPRDVLHAPLSVFAAPDLSAAREAPLTAAGDLAAAYVASPADRHLIDDANSAAYSKHIQANLKNGKFVNPGYYYTEDPDLDPVLKAYWAYYGRNPAKNNYMDELKEINNSYFPVEDNALKPAMYGLIDAFLAAPAIKNCMSTLMFTYESYMVAYEIYYPAYLAYFADLKTALEAYKSALTDEWRDYASNR